VRTLQAKKQTDKRHARSSVKPWRNAPLDMAQASLMALVTLVLGRSVRVRPDVIDGLGNLAALARMAPAALARRAQLRKHEATRLAAAFELGRRYLADVGAPRYVLHSSASVARWFRLQIGTLVHEELWLVALDGRSNVRGARCVARGGLHGASFSPVDIIRNAVELGASSFVLVHNHPGGHVWPSLEDAALTVLSYKSGEILRMPLADHVIVGPGKTYFSFLDSGMLPTEPADTKFWLHYDKGPRRAMVIIGT